MFRGTLSLSLMLLIVNFLYAQNFHPYTLYDSTGKSVKFQKLIKKVSDADIILFGELHNDPIAHWLQLQLMKQLPVVSGKGLIGGAEMFETDNQLILQEYMASLIDDKRFESGAGLWDNYATDYKPLLLEAKRSGIPFYATNIPRRYANLVSRSGFEVLEKLDSAAFEFLPPLPVPYDPELPAYRNMMKMSMPHGKMSENFPKAQAIKDATMAHFIGKYFREGSIFLHFNGSYHSDNYQGIFWYLNKYRPGLSIKTISTVKQSDTGKLMDENKGLADYIIVVPEDMTTTY